MAAAAAEACVSAARQEKSGECRRLSLTFHQSTAASPQRLHLCSKHLKRFPSSLSSAAIYLFIHSSFFITIIYPRHPPTPHHHQPPLTTSSPHSARFSSSYFSFFPLNCLTPKIQISQLGDPLSFLKNEHITSYIFPHHHHLPPPFQALLPLFFSPFLPLLSLSQ